MKHISLFHTQTRQALAGGGGHQFATRWLIDCSQPHHTVTACVNSLLELSFDDSFQTFKSEELTIDSLLAPFVRALA
jgi:hypothetical protein